MKPSDLYVGYAPGKDCEQQWLRGSFPRSPAYREGVLAAMRANDEGVELPCPYQFGQVEADAFVYGVTEARHALRMHSLFKLPLPRMRGAIN